VSSLARLSVALGSAIEPSPADHVSTRVLMSGAAIRPGGTPGERARAVLTVDRQPVPLPVDLRRREAASSETRSPVSSSVQMTSVSRTLWQAWARRVASPGSKDSRVNW
jgi:hypothetical protein